MLNLGSCYLLYTALEWIGFSLASKWESVLHCILDLLLSQLRGCCLGPHWETGPLQQLQLLKKQTNAPMFDRRITARSLMLLLAIRTTSHKLWSRKYHKCLREFNQQKISFPHKYTASVGIVGLGQGRIRGGLWQPGALQKVQHSISGPSGEEGQAAPHRGERAACSGPAVSNKWWSVSVLLEQSSRGTSVLF